MKHARKDYDRIQDPALNDASLLGEGSTPIGEDEPVMLFRAKDVFFVPVLEHYALLLKAAGAQVQPEMVRAVEYQIQRAKSYAAVKIVTMGEVPKFPDMPTEGTEGHRTPRIMQDEFMRLGHGD